MTFLQKLGTSNFDIYFNNNRANMKSITGLKPEERQGILFGYKKVFSNDDFRKCSNIEEAFDRIFKDLSSWKQQK